MVGDFQVEGGALKKILKKAKKGPVSFGFNGGKSEETSYLAMDRKKAPQVVGKDAKESGEGGKFAFGTAAVSGKLLTLTCQRELPGLAKKLKKYLKSQKVMLNVVVLDADGNPLESDIEDNLPDDPELDLDEDADDDGEERAEPDATTLVQRLADLRETVATLPETARTTLSGPLERCAEQLRDGDLSGANLTLDKLEAAAGKLAGQVPPPPPVADPQAMKIAQGLAALRSRIGLLDDPSRQKTLLALVEVGVQRLRSNELEAALGIIRRVQDALKASTPQKDEETQAGLESQEDQLSKTQSPEAKEWEDRYGAIRENLMTALSQGLVQNVGDLRTLNNFATASAANGDHAKALAVLPRIISMLNAGRADDQTAFEAEIPPDVKPFATGRLVWNQARKKMVSEVDKIRTAILAAAQDDELIASVAGNVSMLTDKVEELDESLEKALDAIVNAPVSERGRLKRDALEIIGDYMAKLEEPFFKDIDANSGFGQVAVASTAHAALAAIEKVLKRN